MWALGERAQFRSQLILSIIKILLLQNLHVLDSHHIHTDIKSTNQTLKIKSHDKIQQQQKQQQKQQHLGSLW